MVKLSDTGASIDSTLARAKQQLGKNNDYIVGSYLFPGWLLTNGGGPNPSAPWDAVITSNPERTPILGAYDESLQHINDARFGWMQQYGLDFVAIDWFMQFSGATLIPFLEHVVNCHKACTGRKPKFCLQFANQTNGGSLNTSTWVTIYNYWIANYFFDPFYYKINGCPVVIINSHPSFRGSFASNAQVHQMLDQARTAAVAAGLPGIYFLAGHADSSSAWTDVARIQDGWDAVCASNVFKTTRQNIDKTGDNTLSAMPTTYAGLHNAIFQNEVGSGSARTRGFCRGWLDSAGVGPVWIPCSAGFQPTDDWNLGVPTTLIGQPTLSEFHQNLAAAKSLIDANPTKTARTITISAWNELGEGGFIEPTAKWGFELLRAIRTILSNN